MLKVTVAVAALVATAALAQAPSDTQTQSTGINADLNQIVCVNERETGSRVATRRVCRTRAEWAQHNAEQRRNLDRAQSFKPVVCGEGGTRNKC